MDGCESWTIKKAKRWRIDAFELWCWRRLLRVPWIARRSNQSILKEISPECSLEGLMLKLKLQYFGHSCEESTHWKRLWCWERLKAGGEGDDGGWDGWMASPTQWTWVWVNSGSWWWTGRPGMLQSWGCKELDTTEQLNWTDKKFLLVHLCFILVNRNFNCMKPVMWDLAYAVLKDCISKKKFEQKFRWFLMKKDKMY